MTLPQGVEMSHIILERFLSSGDLALDATCGNGYDTIFLAEQVGSEGRVLAIDIQDEAAKNTRQRLANQGLTERAVVVRGDHSRLPEVIGSAGGFAGDEFSAKFRAVIFNLGFLPGSEKETITKTKTTLPALKHSLELLQDGGVLVVVSYTGHQGGEEECHQVLDWAGGLDYKQFNVLHQKFINQPTDPPQLIAVERR